MPKQKKSEYEKQRDKLIREISSLQRAIKNFVALKGSLLREKKEALRKLNLEHNAVAIRSMSQMMLDASDAVDLESLLKQKGFRSAFEAFLRREAEGKDASGEVPVKNPAASAAETSPVSAEDGPKKGQDAAEKVPEKENAPEDSGKNESDKPSGTEEKPDEKTAAASEATSKKEPEKPAASGTSEPKADEKKTEAVFTPSESAGNPAPEHDDASDDAGEDSSEKPDEEPVAYHWDTPKVWDGK